MDLLRDLLQLKITLPSHIPVLSFFVYLVFCLFLVLFGSLFVWFVCCFLNSQEQVLLLKYMAIITALDLGRLILC